MITSTFNSVKEYVPLLMRKFNSIVKGKVIKKAGSGEEVTLSDSKVITKERKEVKDSFYNYIDVQYANLDHDIHSVKSNKKSINIPPKEFEALVSKYHNELTTIFDDLVIEKRMGPSLSKYASIVLSGILIENLNKQNK